MTIRQIPKYTKWFTKIRNNKSTKFFGCTVIVTFKTPDSPHFISVVSQGFTKMNNIYVSHIRMYDPRCPELLRLNKYSDIKLNAYWADELRRVLREYDEETNDY